MTGSSDNSDANTERHPLIAQQQQRSYSSFSTRRSRRNDESESTRSDSSSSSSAAPKRVYLKQMFRFATTKDKWVIAFGTIAAVIHGAGMPILARIFGLMTDIIIQQSVFGFANDSHTNPTTEKSLNLEAVSFTTLSSVFFSQNATINGPVPKGLLTRQEFVDYMTQLSLYYVYIGIGVFFASFIQAVFWEWSCERQAYRLRQEFLYQVLRQEISWYDHHQTGDLAMKLSDDLERIREGLGHKFSMIIQFWSSFLAGFVVGFAINWQLTLIILALSPLLIGSGAYVGLTLASQSSREQQKYGKAGAVAEEILSSMKTVASFGGEQRAIERYESQLMDGLRLALKKYRSLALGIGVVFVVLFGSYATAFWFGVQMLNKGLITPGSIFTVFLAVLMGAFSVGNAVPYIATLGVARGSAAVVFDIIDSMPRIDPYSKAGLTPATIKGRIQFRNVDFTYPSRREVSVLHNFTIDIEPGKTVAFVGHSGVGKSTLVSLILRFYDPDSGAILLDGHDLKLLNLAWIRHHIGVVSQEPILFGTTIYENIAYGRDCVTPDEVVTAARMANAHDFISLLPQGYETLVGERGAQLSGGQKQRVAIARALVRDPKILLLDEATSALDARSESIVQCALDRARKGRTTIIIAHRLSTIKDADTICVLKDGVVAEAGTHAELMAKEELYYDLVAAQMSLNTLQEIEADPTADASYYESTEESIGDFDFEAEKTRRRKTRRIRRRRLRALPDPDRARMAEEAEELNVQYPGFFKTLALNRPEMCQVCFGFLGCLICGCVMPSFSFMYSSMFQTVTKQGDELLSEARFWTMMTVVLAVISGFGHWLRTILVSEAGEYLTMRLRLLSFVGVVRQSVGWFDNETNSPGRVSTRLARDAPMVKAAAGHRLAAIITCFVTVFMGLFIAFIFGWQLALVLLALFPLLITSTYISIHMQKSGFQTDAMIMENSGGIANEAIQNIRTVQAMAQEKLFFSKYVESLLPVYMEAHKQGLIYGLAFAFSEAIIFFVYGATFRYAAYLIEEDLMTAIGVYRVFFAQAFSAVAVGQALSFLPDYTKANLAAGLIFNLIELKSQIDPFSPDGLRPKIEGRITFSDVRFCYPSRDQYSVLHGLSFDLQPGKSLALIGHSGCGKSTIVNLIERFYDVTAGQVLIDGYDVRSLNISHLRKNIGFVTQEPVLFDCTIRENIAYGYTSEDGKACPEDLIIKAAREANIHNFIVSLPQGYETLVGERGRQLSGGQKQRIAIARALIRDPKVLLLDEATSALDTENEKIVQEALDKARAGRTCIMIAHRLSTIQNADYIAVITRGKIMEQGTNEQLRARKGLFYKLTKNQQITH